MKAQTALGHVKPVLLNQSCSPLRWRWVAIVVFVLSSTLNYLDRQLLAAVAPTIKIEFHLSNTQYGKIISAFSLVYAAATPFAGLILDRISLGIGIAAPMVLWSFAGLATGLTHSFRGLLESRTVLGLGEAAGIPSSGKATAGYLKPQEFAIGNAFNQVGISLGAILAPLIVEAIAPRYGWRAAFVICGVLGLLWVPLWMFTFRRIPCSSDATVAPRIPLTGMLSDRRLWGLLVSNALVMTLYTLWTNWTTIYFVQERHLTQLEANQHFAWIPPVFATLGAFFGGWMAFRKIRGGMSVVEARMSICWLGAAVVLTTATVPLMPSASLAAGVISLSFFWSMSLQANLHVIHIDFWGPKRAAFGASLLTCSYALMQAFISPIIGSTVDHFGFSAVCVTLSLMPAIGVLILRKSLS
jgi:ACS family hexuronate transporter-like MFS transporter